MDEFRHTFRWVWPSKKRGYDMQKRGRTMRLVKTDDVREAELAIRSELQRELRAADLSPEELFGDEQDIARELIYHVEQQHVEVIWRALGGPQRVGGKARGRTGRKGDVVNMAVLLDDAVAELKLYKRRGGRLQVVTAPGVIYHDDRQICHALERRAV